MSLSEAADALQAGDPGRAEHLLRQLPEAEAQALPALCLLALSLAAQGRHDDALPLFRELTRREPMEVEHWTNLAAAQRAVGDLDGAITAFQAALERGGDHWGLHHPMGLVLLAAKQYQGAMGALVRALELEPDNMETRVALAQAFIELGEPKDAASLLVGWKDRIGANADLIVDIARLALRVGGVPAAVDALETALARVPDHAEAARLLAQIRARLGLRPNA